MQIAGNSRNQVSFSAKALSEKDTKQIVQTAVNNYLTHSGAGSIPEAVELSIAKNKKLSEERETIAHGFFASMYQRLGLGPNPTGKELVQALNERAKLSKKKSV